MSAAPDLVSPFVHATAVSVAGRGVLIRGPSRSGKTSLALALIADGVADLVGDDRLGLRLEGERLLAWPHPAIAGMVEQPRGQVAARPYLPSCTLHLAVDLLPEGCGVAAFSEEAGRALLRSVNLPVLRLSANAGSSANACHVLRCLRHTPVRA